MKQRRGPSVGLMAYVTACGLTKLSLPAANSTQLRICCASSLWGVLWFTRVQVTNYRRPCVVQHA